MLQKYIKSALQNGYKRKYIKFFNKFLSNRYIKVKDWDKISSAFKQEEGVHEDSVLNVSLFRIAINPFRPQDVCNITLSLWRKAPQDVCNVITKKSKFPFFPRHFSQYSTFYLPFDLFPWFLKKRREKKELLYNLKSFRDYREAWHTAGSNNNIGLGAERVNVIASNVSPRINCSLFVDEFQFTALVMVQCLLVNMFRKQSTNLVI